MAREINKADMNIPEQLEAIRRMMCDAYCRFPGLAGEVITEDPDEAQEWLEHNYCSKCPMNELENWRRKHE